MASKKTRRLARAPKRRLAKSNIRKRALKVSVSAAAVRAALGTASGAGNASGAGATASQQIVGARRNLSTAVQATSGVTEPPFPSRDVHNIMPSSADLQGVGGFYTDAIVIPASTRQVIVDGLLR